MLTCAVVFKSEHMWPGLVTQDFFYSRQGCSQGVKGFQRGGVTKGWGGLVLDWALILLIFIFRVPE